MSKYFIQTRKEEPNKGIRNYSENDFTIHDWIPSGGALDSFEEAEKQCIRAIEAGIYRDKNVRICQVVGEFESSVTVKTKEQG
ncbi:hypothetical protein [Oceanobacillus oncorhynchi]|uniref:hypothetical protein n=1 Tax=Oceanobacillus oncorhynchi TaxID=545501 RepID=UPI001868094F|nr:hypothetical protein [Oceanobacillus oncorhynchi]